MEADTLHAGGLPDSLPEDRLEAQVLAFEALRRVLRPEWWDDVDELVRAAFLAGWHAGTAWRPARATPLSGRPGRPDRARLARDLSG
jgi:hypothetical protein